jgi:CheY-like chemotaxis protein
VGTVSVPDTTSDQPVVLLVEDDKMLTELLSEALTSSGYAVVGARSGLDAIQLLKSSHIDLVCTDVHLDGPLTGLEVAHFAHSANPRMPVVFSTGMRLNVEEIGLPGEFVGSLAKPYKLSELLDIFSDLLAKARQSPLNSESAEPHCAHTWHDLRNYYATRQLAADVGIQLVSQALGHSSPRITWDIYIGNDGSSVDASEAIWGN